MLTFFRRIRKGFLDGGRTSKYLLYAIGEIALVVIGILIALQINNWNEEQKKIDTIKVYLQNLVEDIRDDLVRHSRNETSSSFRYYSAQYLLQLAEEPLYNPIPDGHVVEKWEGNFIWREPIPEEYHEEFIRLAFLWTHRVGQSDVTSSAIEEIKKTSEYSFLNNDILKDAITDYYAEWDFRFGPLAVEYINEIISTWQNSLMKEGIINSNPYTRGNPIQILKKNQYLIGTLRGLTSEASWQSMS